jgi:2-keto-4-pentenoate hydratase/2-oxohepta-3-ene-1,7-dioic acid hydratase in catechol pathway
MCVVMGGAVALALVWVAWRRCGPIVPAARTTTGPAHPTQGRIWLSLDGEMKQDSDIVRLSTPPA